jgi:polysaccharide biosynthesis protein PslE
LRTREKATQQIIENYDDKLKQFQQDTIASDDLQRAVNTAKDNYLLYIRKAEEARISQALDQSNILNVAVADNATEPMLPRVSRTEYLLVGLFLALVGSGAVLFAGYRTDSRYYRTPEQVMLALQIPVLAALPSKATARASAAQS